MLDLCGTFTWLWNKEFFIETKEGNFIWNDPDYDGDNTIRRFEGTLQQYLKNCGLTYGRDKGYHRIRDYCGDKVTCIE